MDVLWSVSVVRGCMRCAMADWSRYTSLSPGNCIPLRSAFSEYSMHPAMNQRLENAVSSKQIPLIQVPMLMVPFRKFDSFMYQALELALSHTKLSLEESAIASLMFFGSTILTVSANIHISGSVAKTVVLCFDTGYGWISTELVLMDDLLVIDLHNQEFEQSVHFTLFKKFQKFSALNISQMRCHEGRRLYWACEGSLGGGVMAAGSSGD
ncbi:hypothetical protein Tco_0216705 [Tanacetum coccineum]